MRCNYKVMILIPLVIHENQPCHLYNSSHLNNLGPCHFYKLGHVGRKKQFLLWVISQDDIEAD